MRVLWVCNIMLPVIAQALGEEYSVREGWLSGILGRILDTPSDAGEDLQLGICFPKQTEPAEFSKKIALGAFSREIACYGFAENLTAPELDEPGLEARFAEILADFKPDLVHIFGTEFGHSYACAKAWNKPERTLLGIQGLCTSIAEHYDADLPASVIRSVTLRDFLRKDSICQQKEKFVKRAVREEKTIALAGHITGRTEFDKNRSLQSNSCAEYHFMNETMRSSFYQGSWAIANCHRHEIFVSQADYPLKGFHYLLEAMPEILKTAPDTTICVAGNSILGTGGIKSLLKLPAYGVYLRRLIRRNHLQGKIRVLGRMQEEQMKQAYLSCHVFVCPSAVENSPNSVAEAQLLGVPVAASNAGGIPSVVEHETSGLLFEKGNAKELAKTICRIFEDDGFARNLSEKERIFAAQKYDGDANFQRLLEIYGEIL